VSAQPGRAVGATDVALVGHQVLTRWPAARVFVVIGSVSIVAGGLVAAVTRPAGLELGSWLAAYLVLVAGVAQIALGVGQASLAQAPPPARTVRAEAWWWNVGAAATLAGSLTAMPVITTAGGAASIVALSLFFRGVHARGTGARRLLSLYRGVVAIVMVSTPIGLALAWIRHG
jgi:hypothetical protein